MVVVFFFAHGRYLLLLNNKYCYYRHILHYIALYNITLEYFILYYENVLEWGSTFSTCAHGCSNCCCPKGAKKGCTNNIKCTCCQFLERISHCLATSNPRNKQSTHTQTVRIYINKKICAIYIMWSFDFKINWQETGNGILSQSHKGIWRVARQLTDIVYLTHKWTKLLLGN